MITEADVLATCLHNPEDVLRDVFFPMFKHEFDHITGVPSTCGYNTPVYCQRGITFDEWKLIRYEQLRKANYPTIEDQLDMYYHDSVNGTSNGRDAIAKVKEAFPKPEPDSWLQRFM